MGGWRIGVAMGLGVALADVGHAAPTLRVDNACGEPVMVWLTYLGPYGDWIGNGPWFFDAGDGATLIYGEDAVELHGERFLYYAETMEGDHAWSGSEAVAWGDMTRSMIPVDVESDDEQSLVVACDGVRSPVPRDRVEEESLPFVEPPEEPDEPVDIEPVARPPVRSSRSSLAIEARCPRADRVQVWLEAAWTASGEAEVRRFGMDGEGVTSVVVHGTEVGFHALAERGGRRQQAWGGDREVAFRDTVVEMASHRIEEGPLVFECSTTVALRKLGARVEPRGSGLVVVGTRRDGPARRAGLQRGDVITHVDGARVRTVRAVRARLAEAGRRGVVQVRREGAVVRARVKLK